MAKHNSRSPCWKRPPILLSERRPPVLRLSLRRLLPQSILSPKMQFANAPAPVYFSQLSTFPPQRAKPTAGVDPQTRDQRDVRLEYPREFADY